MSIAAALAWTGVVFMLVAVIVFGSSDVATTKRRKRALLIAAIVLGVLAPALFIAAIWTEALT